ncbi:MAG: hypothetical protein IPI67_21225 [Myxococcales bacterium]|nr:hypothetical protein [Myxococcales bacterium]
MGNLHPGVIALIAALVGGVAGGAVANMTIKVPTAAASAEAGPGAAPADTTDLARRVAELERNATKTERTRRLERAVAQAGGGDDADAGAPPGARAIDDPVFETAVRDVIDQIDEERKEERDTRRADRRRRMAEGWTTELATELALNDAQKQKVMKVVEDYYEGLRAMRESDAGPPASRGEWQQRAKAEREKAETKLAQVLDPGQMAKYKGLDDDKKLGVGGGGRRRGRGQ